MESGTRREAESRAGPLEEGAWRRSRGKGTPGYEVCWEFVRPPPSPCASVVPSSAVHIPLSSPFQVAVPFSPSLACLLVLPVDFLHIYASTLSFPVTPPCPRPLSPRPLLLIPIPSPCVQISCDPTPSTRIHSTFQCPRLRFHRPTFLLTSFTLQAPATVFSQSSSLTSSAEKHAGPALKAIPLFCSIQAAFTGTLGTRGWLRYSA